jgi:hypothetical protein
MTYANNHCITLYIENQQCSSNIMNLHFLGSLYRVFFVCVKVHTVTDAAGSSIVAVSSDGWSIDENKYKSEQ